MMKVFAALLLLSLICASSVTAQASAEKCADGTEMVQCLVDPCMTAKCPAAPDAVCNSSYCGGCHATFVVEKVMYTPEMCKITTTEPVVAVSAESSDASATSNNESSDASESVQSSDASASSDDESSAEASSESSGDDSVIGKVVAGTNKAAAATKKAAEDAKKEIEKDANIAAHKIGTTILVVYIVAGGVGAILLVTLMYCCCCRKNSKAAQMDQQHVANLMYQPAGTQQVQKKPQQQQVHDLDGNVISLV